MLVRVLPIFAVIGIGLFCGAVRLFPKPQIAIDVLNRFALYVGFPALVVTSLASDQLSMPDGPGFYVVQLLTLLLYLPLVVAISRLRPVRSESGPLAMGAIFGNIAYLGIPFCAATLGNQAAGLAALSAGLHILVSMCLGPVLLLRLGGGGRPPPLSQTLAKVARQPLVWAPIVGLVIRALPATPVDASVLLLAPVGTAAGPVALFMLGLYLWENRSSLMAPDLPVSLLATAKLAVYPGIAFVVLAVSRTILPMTSTESSVIVFQAAMPVAITTFSIAREFKRGEPLVARGIVLSTVLALFTLPLLADWIV